MHRFIPSCDRRPIGVLKASIQLTLKEDFSEIFFEAGTRKFKLIRFLSRVDRSEELFHDCRTVWLLEGQITVSGSTKEPRDSTCDSLSSCCQHVNKDGYTKKTRESSMRSDFGRAWTDRTNFSVITAPPSDCAKAPRSREKIGSGPRGQPRDSPVTTCDSLLSCGHYINRQGEDKKKKRKNEWQKDDEEDSRTL